MLEEQINLLKLIRNGDLPLTKENIELCFNESVLKTHAVSNQQKRVNSVLEALETERERIEQLVSNRKNEIERLLKYRIEIHEQKNNPTTGKSVDVPYLQSIGQQVVDGHLVPLGLGPEEETSLIIKQLISVTARGEQLIVNENSAIVRYLIDENLVRSQPFGKGRVRIRVF